jgi:hypothetical protein
MGLFGASFREEVKSMELGEPAQEILVEPLELPVPPPSDQPDVVEEQEPRVLAETNSTGCR